jgi:hypothetical protein
MLMIGWVGGSGAPCRRSAAQQQVQELVQQPLLVPHSQHRGCAQLPQPAQAFTPGLQRLRLAGCVQLEELLTCDWGGCDISDLAPLGGCARPAWAGGAQTAVASIGSARSGNSAGRCA